MKCKKWLEKTTKKFNKWQDIALIKLRVFIMTLFLITVWPGFRNLVFRIEWYWYLIVGVLLMIPIFKKMFSNK